MSEFLIVKDVRVSAFYADLTAPSHRFGCASCDTVNYFMHFRSPFLVESADRAFQPGCFRDHVGTALGDEPAHGNN